MRTRKDRLYQVNVEADGRVLPVGPAMLKEVCEHFADTISAQIALGKEKSWRNPHVVPLIHSEN